MPDIRADIAERIGQYPMWLDMSNSAALARIIESLHRGERVCLHCGRQQAFAVPGIDASHALGLCSRHLESYVACSVCGVMSLSGNVFYPHIDRDEYTDRQALCRSCYRERYRLCPSCRRSIPVGEPCPECSPIADAGFRLLPSQRTLGIELEFVSPREPDMTGLGWLKGDGSVHGRGVIGLEFASKVARGDAMVALAHDATARIRGVDGRVNTTCGFHCHVGMTDSTPEQRQNIRDWWRVLEPVFYGLVSPSRVSNSFCKPLSRYFALATTSADVLPAWERDRYFGLNISAFHKHGTYEFRLHHGTLAAPKVSSWFSLLAMWTDAFADITATPERIATVAAACDRSKLSWMMQRCSLPARVKRDVVARAGRYGVLNMAKGEPLHV